MSYATPKSSIHELWSWFVSVVATDDLFLFTLSVVGVGLFVMLVALFMDMTKSVGEDDAAA